MTHERPAVVTAAVWLLGALIALTGVSALLAILLRGEVRDAWASGRDDAGSVEAPAIVPVTVVMLVVVGLLAVVLLEFFRARHGWSRPALAAMVMLVALGTVATLRLGPPTAFVVLGIVMLLLDLGALVALGHPETAAYLRTSREPGHADDVISGPERR